MKKFNYNLILLLTSSIHNLSQKTTYEKMNVLKDLVLDYTIFDKRPMILYSNNKYVFIISTDDIGLFRNLYYEKI